MRKAICRWCGKEFSYNTKKRRYYCSDECRSNGAYAALKVKQEKEKVERKKKENTDAITMNREIIRISEEAIKRGMSYGQYVAWLKERGRNA